MVPVRNGFHGLHGSDGSGSHGSSSIIISAPPVPVRDGSYSFDGSGASISNVSDGSCGSGSDGSGSHGSGSGRFRFQTVPVQDGSGSRRFAGMQTVPTVPVPTVPVSGSRFHSRPYCISVVTEATKVAQKLSGSCPKVDRKLPGS